MDLKSLHYFVAVAEARSVGKAALRLHMAQPPLSVQIRKLESRLGTALFRREPDGMHLERLTKRKKIANADDAAS